MLEKIFSRRFQRFQKLIQDRLQESGNRLQTSNAAVNLMAGALLIAELELVFGRSAKLLMHTILLYCFPASLWGVSSILLPELNQEWKVFIENFTIIASLTMAVCNTLLLILLLVQVGFKFFILMFKEVVSYQEEYEMFKQIFSPTELAEKLRKLEQANA